MWKNRILVIVLLALMIILSAMKVDDDFKNKVNNVADCVFSFILSPFDQSTRQLAILCTNDTHSQIEPASDGKAGYAARKQFIDSVRVAYNNNVLLLDAGDIFQGSPYFNVFDGRLEIAAYNLMGYEASAIGNHEFDKGLDTLAVRMKEAEYQYLCCNYDVTGTVLEGLVKPYQVFEKQGLRVGVLGLGVEPKGLILDDYFGAIRYSDPIAAANRYAQILRDNERCDFVIALSHLGYSSNPEVMSDSLVAVNSEAIDLILGGHTHEIRGVFELPNRCGKNVTVMQTAKSGKEIDMVIVEY